MRKKPTRLKEIEGTVRRDRMNLREPRPPKAAVLVPRRGLPPRVDLSSVSSFTSSPPKREGPPQGVETLTRECSTTETIETTKEREERVESKGIQGDRAHEALTTEAGQLTTKAWQPSYAHPWPDEIPDLGPRRIGPFASCVGLRPWELGSARRRRPVLRVCDRADWWDEVMTGHRPHRATTEAATKARGCELLDSNAGVPAPRPTAAAGTGARKALAFSPQAWAGCLRVPRLPLPGAGGPA